MLIAAPVPRFETLRAVCRITAFKDDAGAAEVGLAHVSFRSQRSPKTPLPEINDISTRSTFGARRKHFLGIDTTGVQLPRLEIMYEGYTHDAIIGLLMHCHRLEVFRYAHEASTRTRKNIWRKY